MQAPPPGVRNPCVRPRPLGLSPPGPPAARPARGLGAPSPLLPRRGWGAARGSGTQERPSCHGRKCDVSQAGPAPPPAAADTGVAGAGRGVGQGCRAGRTRPAAVTLLVGTERRRLRMARMSCLLGSPIVAGKPRRGCPNRTGRADLERLPPPGARLRPRGRGCA